MQYGEFCDDFCQITKMGNDIVYLISPTAIPRRLGASENFLRLSRSVGISVASLTALSAVAVVFLLMASCTTLTEEVQYAREDALILATERYEVRRRECRKAGGVMIIDTHATKLKKQVTRHEYKFSKCAR